MLTPTPHDALFKQVFSQPDHAAGLLRSVLPRAVVEGVDWTTLRACPGSFVDEALRASHSDLLFSADVRGRPALIYVLLEHKSTADSFTGLQLLGYVVRIWQRHRRLEPEASRLPAVIPVVLHHSGGGWTAAESLAELIDLDRSDLAAVTPYLPALRLLVVDLSTHDDEMLRRGATTALAQLALSCLARARHSSDFLSELGRWSDALRAVVAAPTGGEALAGVLSYIMEVTDLPVPELREFLAAEIGDEEAMIMTTADRLRDQGRAEGRAETLLRLLELRFGPLQPSTAERIRRAPSGELDRAGVDGIERGRRDRASLRVRGLPTGRSEPGLRS